MSRYSSILICLYERWIRDTDVFTKSRCVILVFAVCRTHPLVLRQFTPHGNTRGPLSLYARVQFVHVNTRR